MTLTSHDFISCTKPWLDIAVCVCYYAHTKYYYCCFWLVRSTYRACWPARFQTRLKARLSNWSITQVISKIFNFLNPNNIIVVVTSCITMWLVVEWVVFPLVNILMFTSLAYLVNVLHDQITFAGCIQTWFLIAKGNWKLASWMLNNLGKSLPHSLCSHISYPTYFLYLILVDPPLYLYVCMT